MKNIFCLLMLAILILITACGQGNQVEMLSKSYDDGTATIPTETSTNVPTISHPTMTSLPPTPVPSTSTLEPPTPKPPTLTPAPVDIIRDVPYSDDENSLHTASIYLPAEAEGPYPTVVIYHSGWFWYGDAEYLMEYEIVGRYFANRGYAAIVPGYRLSQTDPYPAAVEDAFCALAWVHASAGEYGFDRTRVATLGLDAGADLAALTGAVDEPQRYLEDCPHPLPEKPWLKGVVTIGGYYNPSEFFVPSHAFGEMFQGYISHYLQGTPEDVPDRYSEASPITWVDGTEPAFAVIYNSYNNAFTNNNQALPFAEALDAAGVPVNLIEIVGKFMLILPYQKPASAMDDAFQPTLDDYGFPQAEAFLVELFGLQ